MPEVEAAADVEVPEATPTGRVAFLLDHQGHAPVLELAAHASPEPW